MTCRENSDYSILEGFPSVHFFSVLLTEVFGRHVVRAYLNSVVQFTTMPM